MGKSYNPPSLDNSCLKPFAIRDNSVEVRGNIFIFSEQIPVMKLVSNSALLRLLQKCTEVNRKIAIVKRGK